MEPSREIKEELSIPSQIQRFGMQNISLGHLNSSAAQVTLQLASSLRSLQLYSPLHLNRPGIHRPLAHLMEQITKRMLNGF